MTTTPDRLIAAATDLFAAKGYEGASVRAICATAGTNLNGVSYHFGGKRGLFNAVIRSIGERRLAGAKRILAMPPKTRIGVETRLVLFAEETLASWLEEPNLLVILYAELRQGFPHCDEDAMVSVIEQSRVLVTFLGAAVAAGFLRDDVDVDILAGAILERLNNQVVFADIVQQTYGSSIKEPAYRTHWVRQTIELFLHGALRQYEPEGRSPTRSAPAED